MTTDTLDQPATEQPATTDGNRRRVRSMRRFASRSGRPVAQPPSPAPVGVALLVLAVVAAVAVWSLLYSLVLSGFQEHRAQHARYDKLRVELAGETAPVGGAIKDGAPVALISAPAAGVNRDVVVEGTSTTDLQNGPGHRVDTVLPGQAGVSVIFGKSATFGAPFAHLDRLKSGDVVTATTSQGQFTFRVVDLRIAGDPLPPTISESQGRLTLVGATGRGWRSGWAPTQILYVDADLEGAGKGTQGGGPTAQPANQVAMSRDTSALTPLVLWLELLVVAAIAFVWARRTWGGWQLWLVGTPALLSVVWLVTETATRLLPNLL